MPGKDLEDKFNRHEIKMNRVIKWLRTKLCWNGLTNELQVNQCLQLRVCWVGVGPVTPAVMATDIPRSHSSAQEAGIQAICNLESLSSISLSQLKVSRPHLYRCHNGRGPQAAVLSQTHNHQPTNSTYGQTERWQTDTTTTRTHSDTATSDFSAEIVGTLLFLKTLTWCDPILRFRTPADRNPREGRRGAKQTGRANSDYVIPRGRWKYCRPNKQTNGSNKINIIIQWSAFITNSFSVSLNMEPVNTHTQNHVLSLRLLHKHHSVCLFAHMLKA